MEANGAQPEAASTPNNDKEADRRSEKEEKISSVLDLPSRDRILRTIPCFLLAEILVQGTMVLSDEHVGFYSTIPGLRRSVKIRFIDIAAITKEKIYGIFPTGIGVHAGRDKLIFSLVTSREKLLLALTKHWERRVEEERLSQLAATAAADAAAALSAASGGSDVDASGESSVSDRDSGVAGLTDASDSLFELAVPQPESAVRLAGLCAIADRTIRALTGRTACLAIAVLVAAVMVALLAARVNSLQQRIEAATAAAAHGAAGNGGLKSDDWHLASQLQLALDNVGELHRRLVLLRLALAKLAEESETRDADSGG